MPARNFFDFLGHGGGKQRHLTIVRRLLQNPFHLVDEAHTQHFVGLIQHHGLNLIQL